MFNGYFGQVGLATVLRRVNLRKPDWKAEVQPERYGHNPGGDWKPKDQGSEIWDEREGLDSKHIEDRL